MIDKMKKRIKYIYTGKVHNELKVMAREKCFKCHGKGTFKKRRVVSSKIEVLTCSCILLMVDYPINGFYSDEIL